MAFITSLRIKNFFSIKDEVILDFKASPYNIENNPERLFEFKGEYYNKIISLYGANASGKTTVLKAIIVLGNIIVNQNDENFPISFKNKFARLNSTSELSITFVLNINEEVKQFEYKVKFKSYEYENIGIEDEELIDLTVNKVLINRKKRQINNVDTQVVEAIFKNLESKKSLIQETYKFESEENLNKIRKYFFFLLRSSNITAFKTNLNINKRNEEDISKIIEDGAKTSAAAKNFFMTFFNSVGIDIVDVKINFIEKDGEKKRFKNIKIFHKVKKKMVVEFELESDGTQMLMKILLDIFIAKASNTVLVIDEFDSIIHPILTPIIINLLIKNDIQIIYSTHNIYNMQFLQNDEIFLIEKDSNHKTIIKAVKDNHEIKGYKNLLTLYENGYLGGLPNVKEILTKIL